MKTVDGFLRACAALVGGMATGTGLTDHRAYLIAVGGAFVGAAFTTPKTKNSLSKLGQRSVELERETGLVFDNFGDSFKLWPGYWEWMKTTTISDQAPGSRVEGTPFMAVRPEGCKDNYWLNPEEHVGLEAVDYFENEVPKLLRESEERRLRKREEEKAQAQASLERLRQRQAQDRAALADAGFAPNYYDQVDHDCQHELMNNPAGDPGSVFCYKCGSVFPASATPLPAAAAQSAASGPGKEYQVAALRVFQERMGRPLSPQEIEMFMKTTEYQVAKLHDNQGALIESSVDRMVKVLGSVVKPPEMQVCKASFNGKHRWVHGVCKCCGLPQR